jgi:hypothetical protein
MNASPGIYYIRSEVVEASGSTTTQWKSVMIVP